MVQDSLYGSERALEQGRELGAREIPGPASTIVTEGIVGTPLYMSPEALWGQPPDASFDLWSAAIVLYEAVVGRNPFQRATWPATLDAITNAPVPDVRQHASECPVAFAELLAACLDRDKWRRPESARELAQRLRAVVAEISTPQAA